MGVVEAHALVPGPLSLVERVERALEGVFVFEGADDPLGIGVVVGMANRPMLAVMPWLYSRPLVTGVLAGWSLW